MKKSLFMKLAPAAAAITLALSAEVAPAATATTTFPVTAIVVNVCTIAATALVFGAYNQTAGTATDATSAVTVNCTTGAAYTVALSAGAGTGATVANRIMTDGATPPNFLNYALYRDTARTQVWGVTTGTDTVAGTGNGAGQALTVYGRIFANQSNTAPAALIYSDTITATVTY